MILPLAVDDVDDTAAAAAAAGAYQCAYSTSIWYESSIKSIIII